MSIPRILSCLFCFFYLYLSLIVLFCRQSFVEIIIIIPWEIGIPVQQKDMNDYILHSTPYVYLQNKYLGSTVFLRCPPLSFRNKKFHWRQRGSSLSVCTCLLLDGESSFPHSLIEMSLAELIGRLCLQSHLKTFPPTPQKSYAKFWNSRTPFQNTPLCTPKIA